MSPTLFSVYVDKMLIKLEKLGVRCYVGDVYCGALGYADDLTSMLLGPTV